MLPSPLTVTIAGTAHSLSRINQDNFGSRYFKKAANLEITLNIRHSYETKKADGQYERHNVDLTQTSFDAAGIPTTIQAYCVIRAKRGTDSIAPSDLLKALNVLTTAQALPIVDWES